MSYANLKQAVLAVEENNDQNDGKWSDWERAVGFYDIIETYQIGELSDSEKAVLINAINSNGLSLPVDLRAAELAEKGTQFDGGGYWISTIEQKYSA